MSDIKVPIVIHRLAVVSLLVVAAMGIIGSMRQYPGAPVEMRLAPLVSFAIWSWVIWKIWRRPREWGLRVGIFLFLMIGFQCCYWWRAIHDPTLTNLNFDRSVTNFVLIYELPIFVAGVFCTLLRFYYPNELSDSTTKVA